jgi:hypothetical protein
MPEAAVQEANAPEPEVTETPATKPFGAFLHEHRNAGLHNEAGEALAEVVAGVVDLQKKGSITVTINVEPAKGDENSVIVTDSLKVKVPQAPAPPSRFFSDSHGNLSRRDPRQPELPLRDASKS